MTMDDRPTYVPLNEAAFRAMARLEPEQVSELLAMLSEYAFNGTEPEGTGAAAAVFEVIRPEIDRAFSTLRKKREAGRKRQHKPAQASTTEQEPAEGSTTEQTPAQASTSQQNGQYKDKDKVNPSTPKGAEGGSRGGTAPPSPRSQAKFTPPSAEEAKAYGDNYAVSRGHPPGSFDVDHFMAFHQSKGWKVGRTSMKDWRAAVRTSVIDGWALEKPGEGVSHDRFDAYA